MSKYKAKKTEIDGIVFDSQAEAARYIELRTLENLGAIKDLALQVPFVLVKGERWSDGRKRKDIVYKADFVYTYTDNGETVVEDVKGFRTEAYKIKRALMKKFYNVEIHEERAR